MLSTKQMSEIRMYLDTSENPVIIFDGDPDGLASFLLLRRYLGKGSYIVARDGAEVKEDMAEKVNHLMPDKIFIVDKPLVSQEFIDKINVPIIWIDHHMPVKRNGIRYYNPRVANIKDDSCTSFLCYEAVKQDLWVAMIGIIADHSTFYLKEFEKEYPDLVGKHTKDAPDVLYQSKFGMLVNLASFLLKGRMKDVVANVDTMIRIKDARELINAETENAKKLVRYYEDLQQIYDKLIDEAMKTKAEGKLLLYRYHNHKASFTGELSNELMYRMPNNFIIVAREKNDRVIMSFRSSKHMIPVILDKAFAGLDGYGGGHEHSCGGSVAKDDFNEFIDRIKKLI